VISSGSRYEVAERIFCKAHLYNEWGYPLLEGELGLTSLTLRLQAREALYVWVVSPRYLTNVSVFATQLDNMPFLAFRIYEDPKRWTDIAAANPQVWYPLDLKMGDQLRIPE
jgi:nucleoid-associated protein YgaU